MSTFTQRIRIPEIRPQAATSGSQPLFARVGNPSGGQALDRKTERTMSARFGHDFSQVRIHTDARAGESAEALGANAFATGRDIVFGDGKYQPGSRETERLLAHELTHIVQQDRRGKGDWGRASDKGDASEREADSLASQVMLGRSVRVQAAPGAAVARDENEAGGRCVASPGGGSSWNSFTDNPLWNFATNDAVSGAVGLGVNQYDAMAEEAKAAAPIQDMNMREFHANHPELEPLGPGSSAEAQAAQMEGWNANSVEEATMREASGPMLPAGQTAEEAEEAIQSASRWKIPAAGLRTAGRVLSPFGVYSDATSMIDDIKKGEYADATADGLGLTSAAIGTVDAAGAGLTALGATGLGGTLGGFASAANPVGAVAGSAAGGYALGKYGLSKANQYAKNHDLFGKGDDGEERDSTEAAGDAGDWVRNHVGGSFGSFLGGVTAIGSSWGTAAYSGVHALGSGIASGAGWLKDEIFGEDVDVDMADMNKAQEDLNQTMDALDMADEERELYGTGNQVAHDDPPPPPSK